IHGLAVQRVYDQMSGTGRRVSSVKGRQQQEKERRARCAWDCCRYLRRWDLQVLRRPAWGIGAGASALVRRRLDIIRERRLFMEVGLTLNRIRDPGGVGLGVRGLG